MLRAVLFGDGHVKGARADGRPYFLVKLVTGFYRNPDRKLPVNDGCVLATFLVAACCASVFDFLGKVIDCGLLSGLFMRHDLKPLAGMVISGAGPHLWSELVRSQLLSGFRDPDHFDLLPSGYRPLTLP